MKAMILAAGKSTRLKNFRGGLPKVLLEVEGRTILERNLEYLAKAGFRDVVINLHYRGAEIKEAVRKINPPLRVHFSNEKTLMGTAGAVRHARKIIGKVACLVLYGDNLTDLPIRRMIQRHKAGRAAVTIGMYHPAKTAWSGIAAGLMKVRGGRVVAFAEKRGNRSVRPDEWVNAGVLIVSARAAARIPAGKPCDFSRDLLPELLECDEKLCGVSGARYVLASDTVPAYRKSCQTAAKLNI